MNLNLVKEMKAKAQAQTARKSSNKSEWKPKEAGDYYVRILPYIHNLDWPITTVWKHFNICSTPFISLSTFGKPDPIREYGDAVRAQAGGSKDSSMYRVANMCDPTTRYYAPILIRGKEEEGVKFWDMSYKDYEKLMAIFEMVEYGDITDFETGRDLKVTHTKPVKDGEYAQNIILAMPSTSPATTLQAVADMIVKMPTVQSILQEPTMDEMTDLLKKFSDNGGKKVDLKAANLVNPTNVVNQQQQQQQPQYNGNSVQMQTTNTPHSVVIPQSQNVLSATIPAVNGTVNDGNIVNTTPDDVKSTFSNYFKK